MEKSVKKEYNDFSAEVAGIKSTSTGVKVTGVSKHTFSQAKSRGATAESLKDSLINPLNVGKVRKDNSQQFIGMRATAALNIKMGVVATVWPTHSNKARKYMKGDL